MSQHYIKFCNQAHLSLSKLKKASFFTHFEIERQGKSSNFIFPPRKGVKIKLVDKLIKLVPIF